MGIELVPMSDDELAKARIFDSSVIGGEVLYVDSVRVGTVRSRDFKFKGLRFHAVIRVLNDCLAVGLAQGCGDTQLEAVQLAFAETLDESCRFVSALRALAGSAGVVLPSAPVLMSAENPSGFKLEDLLHQLQREVSAKHQKIVDDVSDVSRLVQANNLKILECLAEAERLQRDSYAQLSGIAPDDGPEGAARIGGA